ncbi:MAG TPA: tetratricopeptide repeat protein [Thermoanaerobaculia bacterium]|nr:tetratricopeptide repeat protein [Thermoanaerobaculia bacterium]
MTRRSWAGVPARLTMSRGERIVAAGVFYVALVLRLFVLAQLQDEPLFRTPQLDSLEYAEWGMRLAAGDFSWPAAPIHGPGYPMLIGAVLAVTGSLTAVRVVQAILGSLAALLLFATARRFYGPLAGAAAGLLHAVCAPLILIDVSILAESLLVFLLTLVLWLTARLSRGEFRRPALLRIVTGLLLGFAIVVRPTAIALVPLVAWFALRGAPRRGMALLHFTLAVAYPVVPVVIHNYATPDQVVAVQSSGGMNFYIGNSPLHDGTAWARPGGEWDTLRGTAWRAGVTGAAAEDRFFLRLTLREIGEHPLGWLRLVGSKALWLIQNEEVRDSHSFHFFAASSPLLRRLPRFGVVFALAVCGIAVAARARRMSWLLTGYALIIAATAIGLVAGFRYRVPIMPPLFIYAGAAVAFISGAAAQRRWRSVGGVALLFIFLLILSNVRRHEASHEFSEETAMTALALRKEGRPAEAAEAARRAIAMNPRRSIAWIALGDIEAGQGRWDEAEQAWRQAIAVDPNAVRAWSHLALAHIRRGEREEGEAALRHALAIRADGEAAQNLETLTHVSFR